MLDNARNQLSKFRTKNWFITNDDSCGTYNTNSQIKFNTSKLKSSLSYYSDAYVLLKGTITVPNTGTTASPYCVGKSIIFKSCAPFTGCMNEINNTQINNARTLMQ